MPTFEILCPTGNLSVRISYSPGQFQTRYLKMKSDLFAICAFYGGRHSSNWKVLQQHPQEDVAHLWLIDPDIKTLEAYELTGDRWMVIVTHGGEEPARVAPFDALALELGTLWV
jgi:hypothetical protein